jgi:radical SAM superfamily enzyme YgiQ (UPF0313 family)
MKKVMLMYPNCRWVEGWEDKTIWNLHPYNLCLLSATIEDRYEIKIIDANIDNLSREQFAKILEAEKPDIVGISVLTNEYGHSGIIAGYIAKQVNPAIITILGGVHAASDSKNIIQEKSIDYLVVGEGEFVLGKLCDHITKGAAIPTCGIVFKKDSEIINLGRADFIEDLNALPFPSYEKVDFARYTHSIQRESVDRPRTMPYANIITSRGCPYKCCFCQVGKISGNKPRLRSVDNILKEIEMLKEKWSIDSLIFDDDNLVFDKERAKGIFQGMVDRRFNLKWNAIAMAAYKLDEALISAMKESGCQYVDIAIESGVERILEDIIHKPLKLDHALKVASLLKKYQIDFAANFVIGFPGETWDEIRQTMKFAEEFNADYTKIFIATPLPNTELYDLAKRGGYLKESFSFNKHLWTDGWIDTEEFRSKDLKILRAYEWERINFSNPDKCGKVADMMGIDIKRLTELRKNTLSRANP